jgi:hypothetical protein
MGERRGTYRVLVGTPEGKRPLGRARRGWKMILKGILEKLPGWERTELICFRRDRWSA